MFNIGTHTIRNRALLSPMAGLTDIPMRRICREFGAGLATSEMVTSDRRLWQSDKSRLRLRADQNFTPNSVQIAGSDPQQMADAAIECVRRGAQIIDINMGCPAKKVCRKQAGSALLKDEKLVANILSTVVKSVTVPVTLKTRTGWDRENKNAVRIAKIAESEGIAAIALHGRTRACKFLGKAEYDTIAEVVDKVKIPIIANGDIRSPQEAKTVLQQTGAAAILIGRAALGNPWIFTQINHFLETGDPGKHPSNNEIREVLTDHVHAIHQFYGEGPGVKIARKHLRWYSQYIPAGHQLTKTFNNDESPGSQHITISTHFEQLNTYEEMQHEHRGHALNRNDHDFLHNRSRL